MFAQKWTSPLVSACQQVTTQPLDRRGILGMVSAPQSVPTQQTVYVVAPTLQLLTISQAKPFLSNTTWQARHGQLAEQFYLCIQTPLDRRGMASLQSNSTLLFKQLRLLTISLAKPFLSNTTWPARHGQLAEQIYLFIQPPQGSQPFPQGPHPTNYETQSQSQFWNQLWNSISISILNLNLKPNSNSPPGSPTLP